jgi:Pro-kumamolisin, activation domain
MTDSTNPRPVPQDYQRIEGSERRLAPGTRLVRGADPDQILPVLIRVQVGAGQAGLDRVVAFVGERGLGVLETNADQRSVVVWGTVGQLSEIFAVSINVYESAAQTYRGCEGHLYLPAELAGMVENVLGLIEDEIEHIERVLGNLPGRAGEPGSGPELRVFDLTVPKSGPQGAVNPAEFSLVQEFDVDWLADPGCQRMLDNMAASPTAFQTVRVMKVFTSGTPEDGTAGTSDSGNVWPAGGSINLAGTLNALAELTSRGLVPFVVLGFFPDGIYANTSRAGSGVAGPEPPISSSDWGTIVANWKMLVQAFFDALLADTTRFGAGEIAKWWFEVWNEPDVTPSLSPTPSWSPDALTVPVPPGTTPGPNALNYYQQLYQATSDAIKEKGYKIRLGGPAIMGPNVTGPVATTPPTTPTLMSEFVAFVKSSGVQCDFLSFHGKGEWDGCLNGTPSLQLAVDAADQTAQLARAAGLSPAAIVNDEADMRANFAVPFRPRMTQQFPAWLAAMMVAYDSLSSEYAPIRFVAGSDNAELQLVGMTQYAPGVLAAFAPAAFGQQRSIMTAASSWSSGTCPTDLLKVPAYNFYELLRLLGDQHGTFLTGAANYYPHSSDLFHMITVAATHIGSVFCVYPPSPPGGPARSPWPLNYSILGIPWSAINWYQFQIDETYSNGFSAADGFLEPMASICNPDSASGLPRTSLALAGSNAGPIRQSQELSVAAQAVGQPVMGGRFSTVVNIPAYTTTVFWITEHKPAAMDMPTPPDWEATAPYTVDTAGNVVLRWQPDLDPTFYSYKVYKDAQKTPISPIPLRAALWVDTAPSAGNHTYQISSVSASGHESSLSVPLMVPV